MFRWQLTLRSCPRGLWRTSRRYPTAESYDQAAYAGKRTRFNEIRAHSAIPQSPLPALRHRTLHALNEHIDKPRPVEIVLHVHPYGTFGTRP